MKAKDAEMRAKDDGIANLKRKLAVEDQVLVQLKSATATVAARLTALEQQPLRSAVPQTVSTRNKTGALGE